MCTDYISHHIRTLAPTEIFTTRQMLIYGTRAAVDSALCRMVGSGFIVRLARGVFVRDDSKEPTMAEIVKAKLQSFQSYVSAHAESILFDLSMVFFGDTNTFAKYGSSSSFATVRGRAYLKNICGRKMSLCQTLVGRMVYALWYLGMQTQSCSDKAIDAATADFNRQERELFWMAGSLMPAWLNSCCAYRYPSARIVKDNPFQSRMIWTERSPAAG